jgi:DHA1 family tetracycline resistance protein-like MFS transporter
LADISEPKERTKYLGWLGALVGASIVIGPFISSVLAHLKIHFSHVALIAAGIALVNFAIGLIAIKESLLNKKKCSSDILDPPSPHVEKNQPKINEEDRSQ